MNSFLVFRQLQSFLEKRTYERDVDYLFRKKLRRMSGRFTVKDKRLFYVGPKRNFLRLVVLSEEEKTAILRECHSNPDTGSHYGKRTTRERVIAGYYWYTIKKDVEDWVKGCLHCQHDKPIKTEAPVFHSLKIKEPWEVIELDVIGSLPETSQGNNYVLTMTDLYTKWVVAEPLRTKTAVEVASAIVSKLYTFGIVRKIITDQSKDFVNKLNESIYSLLNIQHAVSRVCHPKTNGQDERTNQNIKRALRIYVNDSHDDWDIHLPAVVYGINTAKQCSRKYSPYFLMFHRQPHLPEVMNACQMRDSFEVGNVEEEMEKKLTEVKNLNAEVLQNIERPHSRQQKNSRGRKRKFTKVHTVETRDECLISGRHKTRRTGDTLSSQHRRPYIIGNKTKKEGATVLKGSTSKVKVSRLRPYYGLKNKQQSEREFLQDHGYSSVNWQLEHSYSSSGAKWEKDVKPPQEDLSCNNKRAE